MLSKDLVAASATPVVLSLLSRRPSYGYEIIKQIQAISNGQIEWSEGMLYPVLRRLEERKLIESYATTENGRTRKYYRLKPAGRQALKKQRHDWLLVDSTLKTLWGTR
jgi:DNA-binding PadR family transcriptional regulator